MTCHGAHSVLVWESISEKACSYSSQCSRSLMSLAENFQCFLRQVAAPQEADALLLVGDVQQQLDDPHAVVDEIALPLVDLAEARLPDVAVVGAGRYLLRLEMLGMDAHDEHLLVVRTVEHRDLARIGQMFLIAPQKLVGELLG